MVVQFLCNWICFVLPENESVRRSRAAGCPFITKNDILAEIQVDAGAKSGKQVKLVVVPVAMVEQETVNTAIYSDRTFTKSVQPQNC